jgi:hypothetical protein
MGDDHIDCRFPGCERGAVVPVLPTGEEGLALCPEHRTLLLDDPEEFRRLWGALDPRPRRESPPFQARRTKD